MNSCGYTTGLHSITWGSGKSLMEKEDPPIRKTGSPVGLCYIMEQSMTTLVYTACLTVFTARSSGTGEARHSVPNCSSVPSILDSPKLKLSCVNFYQKTLSLLQNLRREGEKNTSYSRKHCDTNYG